MCKDDRSKVKPWKCQSASANVHVSRFYIHLSLYVSYFVFISIYFPSVAYLVRMITYILKYYAAIAQRPVALMLLRSSHCSSTNLNSAKITCFYFWTTIQFLVFLLFAFDVILLKNRSLPPFPLMSTSHATVFGAWMDCKVPFVHSWQRSRTLFYAYHFIKHAFLLSTVKM